MERRVNRLGLRVRLQCGFDLGWVDRSAPFHINNVHIDAVGFADIAQRSPNSAIHGDGFVTGDRQFATEPSMAQVPDPASITTGLEVWKTVLSFSDTLP